MITWNRTKYTKRRQKCLFVVFLFLITVLNLFALNGTVFARNKEATRRTYEWLPYFIQPCQDYDVPLALALAIARQESGTRPWTINVQGKGYFLKNKEEAYRVAKTAWDKRQSFDVGMMQINSYWFKKYNITLEEVLDPQKNINMGVWILANEIKRYGLTWRAVGAYHTPLARNPERAKRYALGVIALMRKISDSDEKIRNMSEGN